MAAIIVPTARPDQDEKRAGRQHPVQDQAGHCAPKIEITMIAVTWPRILTSPSGVSCAIRVRLTAVGRREYTGGPSFVPAGVLESAPHLRSHDVRRRSTKADGRPAALDAAAMQINASAERHIDAPARRVYSYIADFRQHHPNFLPPQFSDLEIESGGVGAGTVHRFRMTLGGRTDRLPRSGRGAAIRVACSSSPIPRAGCSPPSPSTPSPAVAAACGSRPAGTPTGSAASSSGSWRPAMLRQVYRDELRSWIDTPTRRGLSRSEAARASAASHERSAPQLGRNVGGLRASPAGPEPGSGP